MSPIPSSIRAACGLGSTLVHPRLRRVPVSQQCKALPGDDRGPRVLDGDFLRKFPGTSTEWPSDITVLDQPPGGRHADDQGRLRRSARRLYTRIGGTCAAASTACSRPGRSTRDGSFVDGMKISPLSLKDLDFINHHSIRLRIGVKENARNPGGLNIFGRGFGNYDQDIVLKLADQGRARPRSAGPTDADSRSERRRNWHIINCITFAWFISRSVVDNQTSWDSFRAWSTPKGGST